MRENAIVIRRFVDDISQLERGVMELEKGQFGFARNDLTLVCRDTDGEFYYIKTDTAMLDLILVKEPVETAGSLPGDDATGTLRMVLNSNSYYFKAGLNWVRMPDINYYDEQLNEIKNKARNINVTDNNNGSFSFTNYEGDETTIQSRKKVQSSDETVDITEGTDNFDLSIERSLNETKQEISQIYVKKTDIDIAGGVAGLDINSKIKLSQIPDSILGQVEYCGIYYADTGVAKIDLRYPVGRAWRKGDYMIAENNGNKLPDDTNNATQINTGDWAVHNGTTWDIIRNSDAVTSVDGKTGNVVLDFGLDAETESGSDITTPAVPSGTIRSVVQAVWAKIRQLANAIGGKANSSDLGYQIKRYYGAWVSGGSNQIGDLITYNNKVYLGIGNMGGNTGAPQDNPQRWLPIALDTIPNADGTWTESHTAAVSASNGNHLVRRTPNGYIYATYFQQSSSEENKTEDPGGVFYYNSQSADRYQRKWGWSSFITRLKAHLQPLLPFCQGTGMYDIKVAHANTAGSADYATNAGHANTAGNVTVATYATYAEKISTPYYVYQGSNSYSGDIRINCSLHWSIAKVGNLIFANFRFDIAVLSGTTSTVPITVQSNGFNLSSVSSETSIPLFNTVDRDYNVKIILAQNSNIVNIKHNTGTSLLNGSGVFIGSGVWLIP